MKNSKIKLSIIIPAFNEEKTVGIVLDALNDLKLPASIEKEIIVVDDGSTDATRKIVKNKEKTVGGLKFIIHEKNKGKGAAVQTGIKNSTGDLLLIQDADLEYNPADIPMLIDPILNERTEVVYGTRLRADAKLVGKDRVPLPLNFVGNKFLSLVTSLLYGEMITDMETGYKVFSKEALEGIKLKSRSFDFEPEITAKILRKGLKILELDIKVNPRGYDEGKKIRPVRDGMIALWTLVKYRFSE